VLALQSAASTAADRRALWLAAADCMLASGRLAGAVLCARRALPDDDVVSTPVRWYLEKLRLHAGGAALPPHAPSAAPSASGLEPLAFLAYTPSPPPPELPLIVEGAATAVDPLHKHAGGVAVAAAAAAASHELANNRAVLALHDNRLEEAVHLLEECLRADPAGVPETLIDNLASLYDLTSPRASLQRLILERIRQTYRPTRAVPGVVRRG
jgi:tetratricopeptide (TPR) repeat protein